MRISIRNLRALIIESVIDASDRFKKKSSDDFRNKISKIVGSIPDMLEKHAEIERNVNKELASIEEIPHKFVSQRKFRFAVPLAFEEIDGWSTDVSVFIVISHTYPKSSDYEQIKAFVSRNSDAFLTSINAIDSTIKEIETRAVHENWPRTWKRYSNWNSVMSNISRFKDNIQRMLKF